MAKRTPAEYRAKITDDAGLCRAKVPSPLIREMGGRPGDYIVFNDDGARQVTLRISRTKSSGKAKPKSGKGRAIKSEKKR